MISRIQKNNKSQRFKMAEKKYLTIDGNEAAAYVAIVVVK
jgi:hypothetical protein